MVRKMTILSWNDLMFILLLQLSFLYFDVIFDRFFTGVSVLKNLRVLIQRLELDFIFLFSFRFINFSF